MWFLGINFQLEESFKKLESVVVAVAEVVVVVVVVPVVVQSEYSVEE